MLPHPSPLRVRLRDWHPRRDDPRPPPPNNHSLFATRALCDGSSPALATGRAWGSAPREAAQRQGGWDRAWQVLSCEVAPGPCVCLCACTCVAPPVPTPSPLTPRQVGAEKRHPSGRWGRGASVLTAGAWGDRQAHAHTRRSGRSERSALLTARVFCRTSQQICFFRVCPASGTKSCSQDLGRSGPALSPRPPILRFGLLWGLCLLPQRVCLICGFI